MTSPFVLVSRYLNCRLFSHSRYGGPCFLIVYNLPIYNRPSMTRCLPLDSRLTRNSLEETIAADVDSMEEAEYAALTLLASVLVLVISTIVAKCVKRPVSAPMVSTTVPQLTLRRNTVHIDNLRNLW